MEARTHQVKTDQKIIDKSVQVNLEQRKVSMDLPFKKMDTRTPQPGDIVLFQYNEALSDAEQWKFAKVVSTTATMSTLLYSVKSEGLTVPKAKMVERSHRSIVILFGEEEPELNSVEYFEKNIQCNE